MFQKGRCGGSLCYNEGSPIHTKKRSENGAHCSELTPIQASTRWRAYQGAAEFCRSRSSCAIPEGRELLRQEELPLPEYFHIAALLQLIPELTAEVTLLRFADNLPISLCLSQCCGTLRSNSRLLSKLSSG